MKILEFKKKADVEDNAVPEITNIVPLGEIGVTCVPAADAAADLFKEEIAANEKRKAKLAAERAAANAKVKKSYNLQPKK